MEEISFIDIFNPDIGKGGVINFSKHRKMARLIRNLEQYQNSSYLDIQPNLSIKEILLHTQIYDEDGIQKKSLNCEPPITFL